MVHIHIKKGLDVPVEGKPEGEVHPLILSGEASLKEPSKLYTLDLKPFANSHLKLLVKAGDFVKIGTALAEDKAFPGRFFVAPASGVVKEIKRGLKRALQSIIIEITGEELYESFPKLNLANCSREELIQALKTGGIFSKIRSRPLDLLADPNSIPKNIFVKALESAPFIPPAEMQVKNHEKAFQDGLDILTVLTSGKVHLVFRTETTFRAFTEAKNVVTHTAEGPHPVANPSLHIQEIAPIRSMDDITWTLNVHDVITIGYLLTEGRYFVDRIIGIGGPGVLPGRSGFFKVREGFPIAALISGRLPKSHLRLVSGDPLNGQKVESTDFLGFYDFALSVIPENVSRKFLHFMGLGHDKYSFSGAYLSGHLNNEDRSYFFSTSLHGEHRAFIDSSLYDKVMPLHVPTMPFIKALLAEDFDTAEQLGLLEVSPEDFALPTFVCPSKIEMVEIVRNALVRYAKEAK